MKMKKIFAVTLLMLVALSAQVTMAQQMPPIPTDEAVHIGKLDNGLTYYIRHNDYPEHKVNFYIVQRVGTMQEDDNQQGLAHFLEHMAFNGSEHFKGNGIIDFTRSLGLDFGADMNAGTSFTRTIYNVCNVPSTRQSALDSCLLILKDWSNGLLLTDKDIDEERGVIHQEWRQTTTSEERMNTRQMANIFPGSKYGQRQIIGLMEIVDNFPYQVLRDYYHKWYRPDNQALVIVGDVDVDYTEAKIREMFGGIPAPAADAAPVVDFPVPDNEQPIFVIDKDKELPNEFMRVMFKRDHTPREAKATMDYWIEDYAGSIVSLLFNLRMHEMIQNPDCPFLLTMAANTSFMYTNTKDALMFISQPKEGQSEATLQAVLTEVKRALEHGFTATEYARAQEMYMSSIEKQYNERNTVSNSTYADMYCDHFLENEPIPSIEQNYQLVKMIVPNLPVEAINQYLRELIDMSGRNLVVMDYLTEKDGATYPTQATMKAAFDAAVSAPVEAYVDDVKQEPLIASLPKPGKIVKEKVNDKLGYKELELSNGVRVILKKTDFKDDEIQMKAWQRGGQSLYGEKDYANLQAYNMVAMTSCLGEFTRNELNKALAGKQAQVVASMDTYYDEVSGFSTVKDLETLFQLTYLTFTDMRKDESFFSQLMYASESNLKNRQLVPENVLMDTIQYEMNNRSWRNKPFTAEGLKNINLDRVIEMAKERMANAAGYTFYFVGNIDEAVIRPLIEQYIATLPANKGVKSNWVNVDSRPQGKNTVRFERPMETPKTSIQTFWFDAKTPYSTENAIKAELLGKLLDKVILQKVREDAGAAYTTNAGGFSAFNGDSPLTLVVADCPVKPEFTEQTLQILEEAMANLCKNVDAESLNGFKNELIKDFQSEIKENEYWMSTIGRYVERGIDEYTGYEQLVKAQTPETIAAFARQLCNQGSKMEFVMTPAE